jgi:hypothetical protein
VGGSFRLRRHRLAHLAELRVDRSLVERRFARECGTRHCDATCCQVGVWVDAGQRDLILAHARRVQRAMDPEQEHDPTRWFSEREVDEPDVPSGRSVDTAVRDGRCVFLNGAGRCVLHTASLGEDRPPIDLKPFVCTAFPLVVLNGLLTIEDEFPNHPRCCSPTPNGELTALEVFDPELRYVLGEPGVDELGRLTEPTDG